MAITAAQVKELREATGVGMMECKKALTETNGDFEKAMEWLRKKGIASAEKKAGRVAAEGVVESYIHMGGKIGVMVELKGDNAEVAHDIAMHIAAANPTCVSREELPADAIEKEREILRAQALNEGKPQQVAEKMVNGRIKKYYSENCLLDQPFVKDDKMSVTQYVASVANELGGEITINAFTRFEKGEGIQKREDDFASEVASMIK